MSKRLYSYATNSSKTLQKWHSISHERLNELFQGAGWVGRRTYQIKPRAPLRDDRGPGIGR